MRVEVLDTLGLKCPEPVLRVASKSVDMTPGDILEVRGDCPTFEKDLRTWCERLGKIILSIKEEEEYGRTVQIQF